jgi:hypothetical protein
MKMTFRAGDARRAHGAARLARKPKNHVKAGARMQAQMRSMLGPRPEAIPEMFGQLRTRMIFLTACDAVWDVVAALACVMR